MDRRQNSRSLWIGGAGVVLQCIGLMYGLIEQDTEGSLPAGVFPIVLSLTWGGAGFIVWGLALHARAKARSAWWGLLGILGIFGLVALAILRDRHIDPEFADEIHDSAKRPADRALLHLTCKSCGYTLNRVQGEGCPECGRPFDLSDPSSLRAVQRGLAARAPWTARWGLICGILSVVSFFIPIVGLVLPTFAIVLSRQACRAINARDGVRGWGHARIGIALGGLFILPGLAFTAYGLYLTIP